MLDILVLLFVTFYTNDFKLPYKYLSLLYVFGTKRTPKGAWIPCGWWVLNGPDQGRDPFIQNSNRSNREKWSTSKGGPVFSKLFRLDRTDPLSFGPKFPEILVEWIAPHINVACEQALFFPLPTPLD